MEFKYQNILSQDELDEIRDAFKAFDTEGKGLIDPKDIAMTMKTIGFETKSPIVYNLICEIQRKYDKPIDFEMFIDSICACLGNRESKEGIRRIYNLFDDDKTGYITLKNLKRVCENLGEMITDDELHEIITRVDSTGEGHITFEDFYAIMMKKKF
uniref:Caltractin-like n=1 Tax=Dermatophagoides pteronyssinus TaxID=6956 RepID=A0A6P6XK40_DERPT|nr:caltractin-like [Dermatophagoides pteronyssinus]